MHKIRFPLGLRPRPAEGAYRLPQSLAAFEGPTSKGGRGKREGRRRGEKEKGKERGQPFPPNILA